MLCLYVECHLDRQLCVISSFAVLVTTWGFVKWGNLSSVVKRAVGGVMQQVSTFVTLTVTVIYLKRSNKPHGGGGGVAYLKIDLLEGGGLI